LTANVCGGKMIKPNGQNPLHSLSMFTNFTIFFFHKFFQLLLDIFFKLFIKLPAGFLTMDDRLAASRFVKP